MGSSPVAVTKWKDCKSRKNLCTENFTYTKKFYVHEIVALILSKIYLLEKVKKTCKPNNRNLNLDWIIFTNYIVNYMVEKNMLVNVK